MDSLERIGTRHRDNKHSFVAESEELDQIAKEAEARLAARRQARYEARNIRLKELEKKQKEEEEDQGTTTINHVKATNSTGSNLAMTSSTSTGGSNLTNLTPLSTSQNHNSSHNHANYSDGTTGSGGVRHRSARIGVGPDSRTSATYSSRRSSTDSSEEGFNLNVRDLKIELKEAEEKFRKAMVANAGLDNEKAALSYQVEWFKDQMEECEEQTALVSRELREKNREFELLKRSHAEAQRAVQLLQAQLDEQTRLLSERGMVLVGNEEEDEECTDLNPAMTSQDEEKQQKSSSEEEEQERRTRAIVSSETATILGGLGKGPLDVRIRRLADERDDLMDTVRRLNLDLEEERQRNQRLEKATPHALSPEETEWETKKLVDDYKFRLQKSEQDINTLQTNVARLESQVIRYKTAAETAERAEEELKTERRKMQRELRVATTRVEELETANKHLETRLGKLKTAKSALLKEL